MARKTNRGYERGEVYTQGAYQPYGYDDEYEASAREVYELTGESEYDDGYDPALYGGGETAYEPLYGEDPEERRQRKIGRYKVLFGMFDFFSLLLGICVSFIMLALILFLVNWAVTDLSGMLGFA